MPGLGGRVHFLEARFRQHLRMMVVDRHRKVSNMAVLLTRPHPDNETSATALRARGFEVLLAPMLRFEPLGFELDPEEGYKAVVVTSSNALRAAEQALAQSRLLGLPLFAVGQHTAATARAVGFANVIPADGDAAAARDRVLESVRAKRLKKRSRLLYLAGADLSRELGAELAAHGLEVVTKTTYRMMALTNLPRAVCDGFVDNRIEAVLHYSRRSAAAFLEAVRNAGIEISALAVPQCCISGNVAAALQEAGAQVKVAASPDESALFEALERALQSRLA
jgi:uroporphyrinogen-III synthase